MTTPRSVEVIFTPEAFYLQRVGGVSRYLGELARHLQARGQHPRIVAGLHRNELVRTLPSLTTGAYLPFGIGPLHPWRVGFNHAWYGWVAARHPDAVVHQTYYGDTAYIGSRPLVVTIHDLIHELFRHRFPVLNAASDPVNRYLRANCARADHLIAVSESTKSDLVRLLGVDPAKVTVVHHGHSFCAPAAAGPPSRGTGGDGEYLIYVGARGEYKNFAALLEAYGRSAALRERFRLVCFGGSPFSDAEQRRFTALGLKGRVTRQSGDDAALGRCYRGATAFVYPSLYEGFGLPLLEAMSQGCPVLCARTSSLPEVAGEAAAYFDPESVESIQVVLETTLADSARLDALRLLGRENARRFSWERCAAETAEVYRRLAS